MLRHLSGFTRIHMEWFTLTVGASGAVFGLFAALFVIQRRFGRDTSAIVGLLAINLVISVLGSGISWQGHLGGLLTGAAVSAVFAWAPRDRRDVYAVGGCAGRKPPTSILLPSPRKEKRREIGRASCRERV